MCIKGFKTDGHSYINKAIEQGAVAIVSENETENLNIPVILVSNSRKALSQIASNFYQNPTSKLTLIGITGTNGKTTTTYLIKNILEQAGKKVGLIGTNQNMIGQRVLETERTTPESLELFELFAQMVNEGVEYVVMEVSSHSLELHRVYGCNFKVAVFTNISQDHLDFHKNMESYLEAKAKLFDMAENGAINIDDEGGKKIFENCKCSHISYSTKENADIIAKDILVTEKDVSFNCITKSENALIRLNIPGVFSVYNALSAISACLLCNIPMDTIKKGLLNAEGVKGRAEVAFYNDKFTIIIDYAHTPDGLLNILETVKGFAKGRVVTLFGCGGDRDKTKRSQMGKIAGELSDFCIITSDNPRTEKPISIINDILEGIMQTVCKFVAIENRYEAIKYAILNAQQNDVIVLAGKGHETYQEINTIKKHFDEREVVLEITQKYLKQDC